MKKVKVIGMIDGKTIAKRIRLGNIQHKPTNAQLRNQVNTPFAILLKGVKAK